MVFINVWFFVCAFFIGVFYMNREERCKILKGKKISQVCNQKLN